MYVSHLFALVIYCCTLRTLVRAQCSCESCMYIAQQEFDKNSVECSQNNISGCGSLCDWRVLDIHWCAIAGKGQEYTLETKSIVGSGVIYTAECRTCLLGGGFCKVTNITTVIHSPSITNICFAVAAIFLECFHLITIVVLRWNRRCEYSMKAAEIYRQGAIIRLKERSRRLERAADRRQDRIEAAKSRKETILENYKAEMDKYEKQYKAYGVQNTNDFAMERYLQQVTHDSHAAAKMEQTKFENLQRQARKEFELEKETIEHDFAEEEARAAQQQDAAHYHAIVAGFSFVANVACAAGKLFPIGFDGCQTWQCRQMVHNALLTLAAGVVDVIERRAYTYVLVPDTSKLLGCLPLGGLSRMGQKLAQLLVSLAWNVSDLLSGLVAAPGTGTLVLSCFACAVQVLLTVMDLRAVCLIQKLNYARDVGEEPEPHDLEATVGFQRVAAT